MSNFDQEGLEQAMKQLHDMFESFDKEDTKGEKKSEGREKKKRRTAYTSVTKNLVRGSVLLSVVALVLLVAIYLAASWLFMLALGNLGVDVSYATSIPTTVLLGVVLRVVTYKG